jgi:hypothetical protein
VMGYTPNSLKLFLLPLLNSSTIWLCQCLICSCWEWNRCKIFSNYQLHLWPFT